MGTFSPDSLALAVDLGTGALKVGIVTLAGEIVAVDGTVLETELLPGGGAIQDAGGWWDAVMASASSVLAQVPRERVLAVSCTGQWASTIPVDRVGAPVGPCLMWLDTRGAEHARRIVGGPVMGYAPRPALRWIRRTGGMPSLFGGDPVSHMLHLERDDPATAAAARWYLEPVDYLGMRFSGRPAATLASMSAAWLTDNRHLDRLEYDPELLRMSGVVPGKLPPLVATGSVIGPLRDAVARELELGAGVRVIAGLPDVHTATLGTGAVARDTAHTSISTTSWISLPVARKKTDAIHSIATIPGLDASEYLIANNQEAAGLCLRWLRDALTAERAPSFDELTALAAKAPPGSGGVLFTPWIAGERSPGDDRYARGGWHNVSGQSTRGDIVRAELEGVAYNSRWLHKAVSRFARRRLDRLRIFGGGAQSDLWCQVYADVLDCTIERVAGPVNVNLRGAGLAAALALGAVRRSEIGALVPVERVFTPQPANRDVYDRQFAEFTRLYRRQRRMFARLNG